MGFDVALRSMPTVVLAQGVSSRLCWIDDVDLVRDGFISLSTIPLPGKIMAQEVRPKIYYAWNLMLPPKVCQRLFWLKK